MIYWFHRAVHILPLVSQFHNDHHNQVNSGEITGLHWTNFFLFFDTWKSTADQWVTEVIPTFLLSLITGQWWIFGVYYIWAAFIQETVEHNSKFNLYPLLTSGQWHLIHHDFPNKNYGVLIPLWDIIFGTRKCLE